MVDFAGWHMPVLYSGLVDEHVAVRERAGLFDVSHMGEIRLRGPQALTNIQRFTVNDASTLEIGQAHYTAMTNTEGGIIDDLLVYRMASDDYLLVVNAGTVPKDFAWISAQVSGDIELTNESEQWAQLALQGPASQAVLSRVLDVDLAAIGYYRFVRCEIGGDAAIVSRTGYTGEDGFEVYLGPSHAERLADEILAAGEAEQVVPAGLGARDTLRLESGMLLYGNDMDEGRSPVEAGLSWIVKLDKGDFVGRDVIASQKQAGTSQKLIGVKIVGRGIPRHGYPVLDSEGTVIGEMTSGTFSPTLKEGLGLAYVNAASAVPDTEIAVEIRGRKIPAKVVRPPFYRRQR